MVDGTLVSTRIASAIVGVAVLSSCSALVDPESLVTRCEVRSGEADPCMDVGLSCQGGVCQPCESDNEICDGRDNDCDGRVDEGHDVDEDGYTWCGGGRAEYADCVPDDPSIHPNAPGPDRYGDVQETCDGLDNDCDGDIDESPDCGAMRTCEDGACEGDLVCDEERNRCVAPRSGGSSCRSDAECEGGFCLTSAAFGLDRVLVTSLCATACCKDTDCAQGAVCVQSGNGARVCLPREVAGRQSLEEGERCLSSSQCASGVCQDRRCVATCASDADCGSGLCRLNVLTSSLLEGAGAWICGQPAGLLDNGDLCSAFVPCASALCEDDRCLGPCGSDGDCPEGLQCRYIEVQGILGAGRVTACVESADGADRTCCTTADCEGSETCLPAEVEGEWGMYCR